MLTPWNLQELLIQYNIAKNLVKDLGLTKEEFLLHIKNKTTIGKRFLKFFKSLNNGKNVQTEIKDFVAFVFDGDDIGDFEIPH